VNKGKPEMFFSTGMCFLPCCVKVHLVKCCTTRQNIKRPKPEFLPERDVVQHGKLGLRPLCFPALVARFDSGITILHGIAPKNTGADHLSSYDATLVKRWRKGVADCDTALAAAPSVNLPLNGTWLDYMTDMNQVEKVIPQHYHLAIALPESKPSQVSV